MDDELHEELAAHLDMAVEDNIRAGMSPQEALLFGVEPTDPATFAAVTTLVLVVVLLASYVPARRAANIDPISALRTE